MPRGPRIKSATGVYHIMFRGINRMGIFMDDQDNQKLLDILDNISLQGEYATYAYCLMKNHMHLLLKEGNDSISRSMKRIGISYSYYFNKKYERAGHVFQDRYKSEAVENERYLLACARYIHNNPVKAELVKNPEDYKWSSYSDYIYEKHECSGNVNTGFILNIFDKNRKSAIEAFRKFSLAKEEKEKFIDIDDEEDNADRDKDMTENIDQVLKKYGLSIDSLSNCKDKTKIYEAIRELKALEGISVRRLSKIISIDRNIINRIK